MTSTHSDSARDALSAAVDPYRTCELATVGKDGVPIAWPTSPLLRSDGTLLVTTSIALPQKAYNIRRNPAVGLLFSDPTGSGGTARPQVLVQGTATCPDEVVTDVGDRADHWARLLERQPAGRAYGANALTRRLFDWYYMRLLITVTPTTTVYRPPLDAPGALDKGTGEGLAGEVGRRMSSYASGVLVTTGDSGAPHLLRVRPAAEGASLHVALECDEPVRSGPASLLFHAHDEQLWSLRSFVVVGSVNVQGRTATFTPERLVPGAGGGPLAAVSFLRGLRRTAAGYLDRRGLPRPQVPWQDYAAVKDEVVRRERSA